MNRRKLIAVAFALTSALSARGATTNDIQVLRQKCRNALAQITSEHGVAVTNLQTKHLATLQSMKTKAQSQGNLDLTLALIDEVKLFEKTRNVPADAPDSGLPDIRNLRSGYTQTRASLDAEKTRRIVTLVTSYDSALEGLQKELTKAGQFAAAMAVAEERKELKANELLSSATQNVSAKPDTVPADAPPSEKSPQIVPWISAAPPPRTADGWLILFDGLRLYRCSLSPEKIKSGKVRIEMGHVRLNDVALYFDIAARDVIVRVWAGKASGSHLYLSVRRNQDYDGYGAPCFVSGKSFGIGKDVRGLWTNFATGQAPKYRDGGAGLELWAIGDTLTLKVDGYTVIQTTDHTFGAGRIAVGAAGGISSFRRIDVKILDK